VAGLSRGRAGLNPQPCSPAGVSTSWFLRMRCGGVPASPSLSGRGQCVRLPGAGSTCSGRGDQVWPGLRCSEFAALPPQRAGRCQRAGQPFLSRPRGQAGDTASLVPPLGLEALCTTWPFLGLCMLFCTTHLTSSNPCSPKHFKTMSFSSFYISARATILQTPELPFTHIISSTG